MSPSTKPAPRITSSTDLDEWVRHVVGIHFHPTHGTPFWIEREKELGVDARAAIARLIDWLSRSAKCP